MSFFELPSVPPNGAQASYGVHTLEWRVGSDDPAKGLNRTYRLSAYTTETEWLTPRQMTFGIDLRPCCGCMRRPFLRHFFHQPPKLKSAMGVQFPEEIRQAYLRHNGSIREQPTSCGSSWLFVPFNWWAPLDELVKEWQFLKSYCDEVRIETPEAFPLPQPFWNELKVRPLCGNEKWLPVGLSGTMTLVYVDLDPAPMGTVGQLMIERGMVEPEWIATNLNHYLEMLIDRVGRKVLVFGEGWELADPDQSVYGAHGYDWNQLD